MKQIERVIAFVASILTTGQIFWVFLQKAKAVQIPFWLFLSTATTCLLLGFFLGRIFKLFPASRIKLRKLGQICFGYLPDSPEKHGWKIILEGQNKIPPQFSVPNEPPVNGVIEISHTEHYRGKEGR